MRLSRLRQMTEDLTQLQLEVERLAHESPGSFSELDIQTIRAFKAAIDSARHSIWPVLIALEQQVPKEVAFGLQMYRMERIRDMLTNLQRLEAAKGDAKTKLFLAELERQLRSGKKPTAEGSQ